MPRLDFWFRLFHHAALGLASVCLLYAESFFLPGPLLTGLYILAAFQVLAFGTDGRRWLLPNWVANLLAGAVVGGGGAWIGLELNSPDSILANLPLPAGLLPYIGPILIGLLVVKLFRPRTPRDFWLLQGVGALQVALACVLATNPDSGLLFGVLLAAYIAFALGCLALHYFQEEQSPKKDSTARLPFAGRMAPFCLRWTLAVAAVAAPLFLLTPRTNAPSWDSSSLAVTGSHNESGGRGGFSQSIDLTRDGTVHLGDQEVFRVAVVAAPGENAPDLPADQRWRGGVLDTYNNGKWYNVEMRREIEIRGPRPPSRAPALGEGRFRLDFEVDPHAGGFFLAEPVLRNVPSDHITRVDKVERAHGAEELKPQVVSTRGPVLPLLYDGRVYNYRYRQIASAGDDPDRSPSEHDVLYLYDPLKVQAAPALTEWTTALLKRLAADPASGLSSADVTLLSARPAMPRVVPGMPVVSAAPPDTPNTLLAPIPRGGVSQDVPVMTPPGVPIRTPPPPPDSSPRALPPGVWEGVARALSDYLARSGEYRYTLDLRRQDANLDPVLDFLVNVKAGHCERFASALALMLRSQGIPSRVVVGFRGADERAPDGAYIIRRNQAHAWVEIEAPLAASPGEAGVVGLLAAPQAQAPLLAAAVLLSGTAPPSRWEWVTLDPTPASALPPPSSYSLWDWWEDGQRTGQELWGGLVVNYGAEQQENLWASIQSPQALTSLTTAGAGLLVFAALGGLTWVGVRRARRRRLAGPGSAAPARAGYARFLMLLGRRGGPQPTDGQTPREFAADARRYLLSLAQTARFADLPDDIVDRLYLIRFGGQTPDASKADGIEARLDQLAIALRSTPR